MQIHANSSANQHIPSVSWHVPSVSVPEEGRRRMRGSGSVVVPPSSAHSPGTGVALLGLFSCCPFLPPALSASPPSVQGHKGKLEHRDKAGTDTCSSICWPSSSFLQQLYLWVNRNLLYFGFSKPCSEVSVFVFSHSCFLVLQTSLHLRIHLFCLPASFLTPTQRNARGCLFFAFLSRSLFAKIFCQNETFMSVLHCGLHPYLLRPVVLPDIQTVRLDCFSFFLHNLLWGFGVFCRGFFFLPSASLKQLHMNRFGKVKY